MIDVDPKNFRRRILSKDYFNIDIPKDWDSLEVFVDWYLDQRMPMMIPWNAPVVCSDDATAMCLFRKGQFQVELYLVHPQQFVPRHAHPNMEVITMLLAGGELSETNEDCAGEMGSDWGLVGNKVLPGEYHGGNTVSSDKSGFGLLAFQKWDTDISMSTAATRWRGQTAGVKQETMIRAEYGDTVQVSSGWADVTRVKSV